MKIYFITYLLPLLASIALALPFKLSEKTITRVTNLCLTLALLADFILLIMAFSWDSFPVEIPLGRISISGHQFSFMAWIDHNTLALLGLGHVLGLLVVKFSHGYLHLEKGYQRFFSTILFFIFGIQLLSLAGSMDLFFAGWEIVGMSSFLLIAFYRSHSRSVSNAVRVYNLYRVCDLGLLLGAVLGHVLWHDATRFSVLNSMSAASLASANQVTLFMLSFCILFASLGKSAQFPFHNWPARAMEGPTPSSAIFYGALSIHAGVFLLLRTQPLWSREPIIVGLIAFIGLATLVLSSIQGRIQTNIKGQIAYSSTSEIGIMYIELALGFNKLVLFHLVCHALYRCFQLLVSPSIVASSTALSNKVIIQRIENRKNWMDKLPLRMQHTLYVLGMTDFFMDISWRGFGFLPWRKMYHPLKKGMTHPISFSLIIIISTLTAATIEWLVRDEINYSFNLGLIALLFSIKALVHNRPFVATMNLSASLIGCMVATYLVGPHLLHSIEAYFFPIIPFLLAALFISWKFRDYDLSSYHALGTTNTFSANTFMISLMVLAGMPITTAYVGEDMLIEGLILHAPLLAALVTLCFMINGLLCVKIYSRLFMGRPQLRKSM